MPIFQYFFLKTKISLTKRGVKLISRSRNSNDNGMYVWPIHYQIKYLKRYNVVILDVQKDYSTDKTKCANLRSKINISQHFSINYTKNC